MVSPNRVVLIGAGGFIGSSLIRFLYEKNLLVSAVSKSYQRNLDDFSPERLDIVQSSVISLPSDSPLFDHPSLVVYGAGSTNLNEAEQNPINDFEVHSNSLLSLLSRLSSDHKFVFLSSGGTVYGESLNESSFETDFLKPNSVYGSRNKILEEMVASVCRKKNIDYIILRLANPYGLDQVYVKRTGLILSLMKSCIDNSLVKVRGNGEQRRDYFSIDDLCNLVFLLANTRQSFPFPILNVGSGKSYSAKEVVSLISSIMGKKPNVEYDPLHLPSDVICSSLDVSRLKDYVRMLDPKHASGLFMGLEESLLSFDFDEFRKLSKMS